jgi:hypothetical protein
MQGEGCRVGKHGSLWNAQVIMPPDLKGTGTGVQRLQINAEIRKWFQKIRRRQDSSLVYVFFKCAVA